jgi:hypothetical protein
MPCPGNSAWQSASFVNSKSRVQIPLGANNKTWRHRNLIPKAESIAINSYSKLRSQNINKAWVHFPHIDSYSLASLWLPVGGLLIGIKNRIRYENRQGTGVLHYLVAFCVVFSQYVPAPSEMLKEVFYLGSSSIANLTNYFNRKKNA